MSISEPQPPKPPARTWSVLLIASLALNLLVIGVLGGALVARHRHGAPGECQFGRLIGDGGLLGFMRNLPRERRLAIREAVEPARSVLRPLRQAAQLARTEVATAFNAVPVDTARIEKALGELVSAEAAVRRAGTQVLLAALTQMTPQERVQFQSWRRKNHRPQPVDANTRDELDEQPKPLPSVPAQR